jgi:hypothetical protein
MIWSEFSDRSFISWMQFKETVDTKYGLTRSELLDAFYEMAPDGSETEAAFILRVERLRVRYQESAATCFRMFKPKLSLRFREGLAGAARAANLLTTGTLEMDWHTLVRDATM